MMTACNWLGRVYRAAATERGLLGSAPLDGTPTSLSRGGRAVPGIAASHYLSPAPSSSNELTAIKAVGNPCQIVCVPVPGIT